MNPVDAEQARKQDLLEVYYSLRAGNDPGLSSFWEKMDVRPVQIANWSAAIRRNFKNGSLQLDESRYPYIASYVRGAPLVPTSSKKKKRKKSKSSQSVANKQISDWLRRINATLDACM